MATHKYIHDNNLQSEFDVIVAPVLDLMIYLVLQTPETLTSLNPGYITYLLASYELVWQYFQYLSDVLYPPYDTIKQIF